jgi:SAM-dependent methyltransferase
VEVKTVRQYGKNLIRYPIYPHLRLIDKFAAKTHFGGIIFCTVCGKISRLLKCKADLRESCVCSHCESTNRKRQLSYVICCSASQILNRKLRSLSDLARTERISIFSTEAGGPIHNLLVNKKNYTFSEYFGPQYKSGEFVNYILNEDLLSLSFKDNSFDIVISTDVLEHVPDPYKAHREIYRVLKNNGRHIFTVPFKQDSFLDEKAADFDENGNLVIVGKPIYHINPLRSQGSLVFTNFSLQMLVELAKAGFRTNLYCLHLPQYGILGTNNIIFEAIKS